MLTGKVALIAVQLYCYTHTHTYSHSKVTSLKGHTFSDEHTHLLKAQGSSDKQESLLKASLLKATLLEKISGKLPFAERSVGEEGVEGEEDGEHYSPSPVSTVSSSGEVGGVYMLYSDATHSEDEEEASGTTIIF